MLNTSIMKRTIKLFILAATMLGGFTMSSCSDLDPIDYSDINPSNFPKSESDMSCRRLSVIG